MNYQIIQPPPVLKEHVRYFWTLEDDRPSAETVFQTLVDDSSGIILQHNEGESAFAHEGGKKLMTGFVYGQSTRPTITFSKSKFQLTGVHFHPHAL
ncbi:MAG TPA: DUF6597 domain-containing transcriptional factor, partial [Chitinophagaceae bacterium]